MADKFSGKYNLVSSDNFDKYLEKLGVGFMTRKIANSAKPDVEFIINGDTWTFKTISSVRNLEVTFQLNKEFEETTGDGRKVMTTFTLENGNRLVQKQKATKSGEKDTEITREVNGDDLVVTMQVEDVQAKRVYKRATA